MCDACQREREEEVNTIKKMWKVRVEFLQFLCLAFEESFQTQQTTTGKGRCHGCGQDPDHG